MDFVQEIMIGDIRKANVSWRCWLIFDLETLCTLQAMFNTTTCSFCLLLRRDGWFRSKNESRMVGLFLKC